MHERIPPQRTPDEDSARRREKRFFLLSSTAPGALTTLAAALLSGRAVFEAIRQDDFLVAAQGGIFASVALFCLYCMSVQKEHFELTQSDRKNGR